MRHTALLVIGLLMILPLVVPAQANDARSYDYVALGASDPVVGSRGVILFPNSDDSPYTQAGVPPIGGVVIPDPPQSPFVMLVEDQVAQPATRACISNPITDVTCDVLVEACSSTFFLVPPSFADELTVFVFNLYSTADLDVCVGTTGTITVPS